MPLFDEVNDLFVSDLLESWVDHGQSEQFINEATQHAEKAVEQKKSILSTIYLWAFVIAGAPVLLDLIAGDEEVELDDARQTDRFDTDPVTADQIVSTTVIPNENPATDAATTQTQPIDPQRDALPQPVEPSSVEPTPTPEPPAPTTPTKRLDPITGQTIIENEAFEAAAELNIELGTITKAEIDAANDVSSFWAENLTQITVEQIADQLRAIPTDSTPEEVVENVTKFVGLSKKVDENNTDILTRLGVTSGLERVLRQPILTTVFPYRQIWPTRDSRVRAKHLGLLDEGLNGTNVFNADDRTWTLIIPPMFYQCRCGWTATTVEEAADAGVLEAQQWLSRANRLRDQTGVTLQNALEQTQPLVFETVTISPQNMPEVWENRF